MELRYFKYSEFDCKDPRHNGLGTGEKFMDKRFLMLLDELRDRCGFPLHINSGYRTPAYNARVSSSGRNGPHTTGKAADIAVPDGQHKYDLIKYAMELGFTGIGVAKTYIHLDTLESPDFPRPCVWIYT